ncbi:MAG: hypothetical protein HGB06_03245 [Chlorobaculum sp.]|jgi:hypothetical protein|nr:hypothetical protein [Chlorobaculum sp.]
MDNAALQTYGWTDLDISHDLYQVEYIPETDRTRYTLHPNAHREVLKRLLALNHKIHEEEVAKG